MSIISADDYEPPLRLVQPKSYTLAEIIALSREYLKAAEGHWDKDGILEAELQLSLFCAWLQKREKEGGE